MMIFFFNSKYFEKLMLSKPYTGVISRTDRIGVSLLLVEDLLRQEVCEKC